MMTRRSEATSASRSMIWTLVSESRAPVGSSARMMEGSFTSARAMATRCICPPDSMAGFLSSWSPSPTFSSAAVARARRSEPPSPDIFSAISTLASTLWCMMRL
nr:hypothetical protein [Eggerthella guodeyinii]